MAERDSKRIIRQWEREIEEETRRAASHAKGPWRLLSWTALWLLWLAVLVALLVRLKALD